MISIIKKVLQINFFFSHIFAPLTALYIYCYTFSYVSSIFQLTGVNQVFTDRLAGILLAPCLAAALWVIFSLLSNRRYKLIFSRVDEVLYPGDFLLIILPLSPVIQYIINNREMLSYKDSLWLIAFFLTFSAIYIFSIPALFGKVMFRRPLMITGLAFVFTIINMASLSAHYSWFESGSLKIQAAVLIVVFTVVWLIYSYDRRILYLFVVINIIANGSFQLLTQEGRDSVRTFDGNRLFSILNGKEPSTKPNVYLLVYDAYVSNEVLLEYGINNNDQVAFLEDHGFQVYPHVYSVGATTLDTMNSVLNVSLDNYGNQRVGVSGGGIAQQILERMGYKTYGLFYSDFMFRGDKSYYDYSFPRVAVAPYKQLLKAIYIGEFRFNIESVGFSNISREDFIEAKRTVFEMVPAELGFVYMHSNLPAHSQNSGACLSDEVERFEERLALANIEMRQDVSQIAAIDPSAIVIVAGDHGPYLTKNCTTTTGYYDSTEISRLDIQDRYSTFLAVRWPTEEFNQYDEIDVLQDLFPSIFAYMYDDSTILDAKIEPVIPSDHTNHISGASVKNGIIFGGVNNGESLFLHEKQE